MGRQRARRELKSNMLGLLPQRLAGPIPDVRRFRPLQVNSLLRRRGPFSITLNSESHICICDAWKLDSFGKACW